VSGELVSGERAPLKIELDSKPAIDEADDAGYDDVPWEGATGNDDALNRSGVAVRLARVSLKPCISRRWIS
jgi:hypothetical protein